MALFRDVYFISPKLVKNCGKYSKNSFALLTKNECHKAGIYKTRMCLRTSVQFYIDFHENLTNSLVADTSHRHMDNIHTWHYFVSLHKNAYSCDCLLM
jgi:hypothetical protein